MKSCVLIFLLSVNIAFTFSKIERYDNYRVYKLYPKYQRDIEFLSSLENIGEYQFWTDILDVGYPVDILVAPNQQSEFEILVQLKGIDYKIMIEDVQNLIDNERNRNKPRAEWDWTDYYTLDEINNWLVNLTQTRPEIVSLIHAGHSYEGRDILGVHLNFDEANQKNSVFIEGNIHACEWISSAVVTYILNELLTSTDPNIRQLAESHNWYFVPVFNPDGFEYSHTTDRLWRKTRVPYGECIGADPNRNWDYHFNEGGSDNTSCSYKYSGPYAFSEPLTKSLSEYISTIGNDLVAYIGFHSYAQKLLIPYGYTVEHLDNYDELKEVGLLGIESLAQRYGTEFEVGNVPELLYIASGGSIDWVKGNFQTRITYTYELRDTGEYGFLLPAEQIIPTALEVLDSLVTIFQEFDKRPPNNGGK